MLFILADNFTRSATQVAMDKGHPVDGLLSVTIKKFACRLISMFPIPARRKPVTVSCTHAQNQRRTTVKTRP
jgi:hypothetical protein